MAVNKLTDFIVLLLFTVLFTVVYVDAFGIFGFGGQSGFGGGYGGGNGDGYGSSQDDGNLHHVHIIHVNHTYKCAAKGGTCVSVGSCNSISNVFKVGLCGYNFSHACCIPRDIICARDWGFCTSDRAQCNLAGNYFSWFGCNSTHQCCKPYVKKLAKSYGGGGFGRGHEGGYDTEVHRAGWYDGGNGEHSGSYGGGRGRAYDRRGRYDYDYGHRDYGYEDDYGHGDSYGRDRPHRGGYDYQNDHDYYKKK